MQSSNSRGPTDRRNRTNEDGTERRQSSERDSMSAAEIADAYDEVADGLARWRRLDRLFAGRYRRRQFGRADGRVLDVACGTGRNFRYLRAADAVVGVDVSDGVLSHAREELARLGLDGTARRMDAQALDFDDDSFDTVVSSFSTCTFPEPRTALEEMGRVCKPDGRVLLLEHGRSDVRPVAWLQDRRADAHYEKTGCRLNHEPRVTVRETSLEIERVRDRFFGLVVEIDAAPAPATEVGRE